MNKQYFMCKELEVTDPAGKELIEQTIDQFSLNEAQERVFQIVANHAVQSCGEHLKVIVNEEQKSVLYV